jgi:hypothetical protein
MLLFPASPPDKSGWGRLGSKKEEKKKVMCDE